MMKTVQLFVVLALLQTAISENMYQMQNHLGDRCVCADDGSPRQGGSGNDGYPDYPGYPESALSKSEETGCDVGPAKMFQPPRDDMERFATDRDPSRKNRPAIHGNQGRTPNYPRY